MIYHFSKEQAKGDATGIESFSHFLFNRKKNASHPN